jgi:hypothetical protein
LSIIGVHTPETDGEKVVEAIRDKARDSGLDFPIAVDSGRETWDAWSNSIWPAIYLIDRRGFVRYWWYGELNWQGAEGEEFMRRKISDLIAEK